MKYIIWIYHTISRRRRCGRHTSRHSSRQPALFAVDYRRRLSLSQLSRLIRPTLPEVALAAVLRQAVVIDTIPAGKSILAGCFPLAATPVSSDISVGFEATSCSMAALQLSHGPSRSRHGCSMMPVFPRSVSSNALVDHPISAARFYLLVAMHSYISLEQIHAS